MTVCDVRDRSINERDLPINMFVDSATYFGSLSSLLLFISNLLMFCLACSFLFHWDLPRPKNDTIGYMSV
jgi:hypothetical protein